MRKRSKTNFGIPQNTKSTIWESGHSQSGVSARCGLLYNGLPLSGRTRLQFGMSAPPKARDSGSRYLKYLGTVAGQQAASGARLSHDLVASNE